MKFLLSFSVVLYGYSAMACFQGIFDARANALSQELQANQQAAQQLINLAQKRYEALAQTERSLQKTYADFVKEKGKLERERNRMTVKVRDAEIKMKRENLKVKRECRNKANEFQTARNNEATTQNVSRNFSTLAGSNNRLNNQFNLAYRRCMRDPLVIEELKLIVEQFDVAVRSLRQDDSDAISKITELEELAMLSQETTIRLEGQQRALHDYHEQVVRQQQAQAISTARRIASLKATGAGMQCAFQLLQSAAGGGSQSSN